MKLNGREMSLKDHAALGQQAQERRVLSRIATDAAKTPTPPSLVRENEELEPPAPLIIHPGSIRHQCSKHA